MIADRYEKPITCFGEFQTAGAAMKQSNLQVAFECRNVATDARWRQAKPSGGGGEATELGASHERLQIC